MTNLGKTFFAVAAIAVLATVGLSLRGSSETPKPAAQAQLTPAQRTELFQTQAAAQPKVVPAVQYDAPPSSPAGLTVEDGEGS
jgi:hypothetical protein